MAEMRADLVDFLPTDIDITSLTDDEIRLHYYTTLHLLDPKMSLAGSDISNIERTLTTLASSTRISREIYAEWIDPETLYPLELIESFAATESARRQMQDNPTPEVVADYHDRLMTLFSDYETALEKIEAFLVKQEAPGTIMFWQGTTRSAYVGEQIKKVREEIATEKRLEADRYACVTPTRDLQCPSLAKLRTEERDSYRSNNEALTEPDRNTLARAQFFANKIFRVRDQKPEPLVDTGESSIVFLANSRCSPNGGSQFVSIYDIPTRVSGLRALRLFGLDDIYLFDVWKEQESRFLPPEPKVPDAYRYTLQPDNYYTCVDYGYDAHTALTVAYVRAGLSQNLPTTNPESIDDARAIEVAARRLVETSTPSDTLTQNFVDLIDKALMSHGTVWLEVNFGSEETRRLINYRDAWHARTGYFELALGTIDDFMVRTLYARPDGTPTIDAPWFFISHSNLVSFYQLANTTVIKETPSLLKNKNTPAIQFPDTFPGILSYEKELRDLIPTHSLLLDRVIAADDYVRDTLLGSE